MKTKIVFVIFIATAFLFCSCGGGGSRQATAANNETSETTVVETIETAPTDPIIIDIVGNLENKREFRLSDFGSSVQYIRLQPPPGVEFSRRFFNVLSNGDNIFINIVQGLFWYSAEGEYIAPLHINKFEETELGGRMLGGIVSSVDLLNGTLFFFTRDERGTQPNIIDVRELKDKMLSDYNFQSVFFPQLFRLPSLHFLIDHQSCLVISDLLRASSTFTAMSIQGDTLFRIKNYYQPTIRGGAFTRVAETFYRIGENVMLQKQHNDTVFALIPPNRVEPAFIMQWGEFKPDMNRLANGGTEEGKFVLQRWVETQYHIFIEYTEGRAFPSRWSEGNVRHHWAIFDKEEKTLTHHLTSPIPAKTTSQMPIPLMFENDIDPVGMPFFPQGVNHRGEMYMVFSRGQVQEQIATGKFNNSRLQALYNRMPDGSFYLMIVN